MPRSRPAYTLIEILLVLGILVAIAAVMVPVSMSMFSSNRVNAAADAVRAEMAKTRNHAMEERRPYRFAIKENTGTYKIAPDTADYWSDAPTDEDSTSSQKQPLEIEGKLPEKVVFASKNGNKSAGDWLTVAIFLGDGSASEDTEINLALEGSQQPVTLRLQAATGSITTASLPASVNQY